MPLLRCITSLNQDDPEAPSQPVKSPTTNASVKYQYTTPIQNDAVSRVRRVLNLLRSAQVVAMGCYVSYGALNGASFQT